MAAAERARAAGDVPTERDRVARVREALERLPKSQRLIVHLHRYEGLTFGEIAELL
jgi:DNA-directed RNA polymerase specialized sigma24 family protein